MDPKRKWSLPSLGRAWQLVHGKDAECFFLLNPQLMAHIRINTRDGLSGPEFPHCA